MELNSVIEALIFSSNSAISTREIVRTLNAAGQADGASEEAKAFEKIKPKEVEVAVAELVASYLEAGRAFTIAERPGGWRLCALPAYAEWARSLFPEPKAARLSPPALETLAIVAYRQPVTKASMEAVRGVAVDGVLQKLIDRDLVRVAGRADLPGRPLLYGTSDSFLEHFGIRDLDDLPNATELRQVQLPEAESPASEPPAGEQLSMAELAEKKEAGAGPDRTGEDDAGSAEGEVAAASEGGSEEE